MSYDKATDLPLIQADVLTTDMSSNVNVTNLKQLKTETKTPTKAINALNEQLDNAQSSAADALQRVTQLEQTIADMQTVIDTMRAQLTADDDAFLQRNCVYVYPNGGTAEQPAHIKTGQIYTMPNPFPGYLVQCQVEVCVGTEWSLLTTGQYYTGSRYLSGGALCAQRDNDLVLVVGNCHVVDGGGDEGYYCHVFFYTFTENKAYPSGQSYDSLPCRIRVWRVGRQEQGNE
jgi:hypothetical protein